MDDIWTAELLRELGKQIAASRNAHEISRVKLAELTTDIGAPLHRVALSRVESGEQELTISQLVALGVALNSDWVGWLIRAVGRLSIDGDLAERAALRSALADLNDALERLRHNLLQAEEGPKVFLLPEAFKESLAKDAIQYRGMIESLESRRQTILGMLAGLEKATQVEDRAEDFALV